MRRSDLLTSSAKYWARKTCGMHRHADEEWFRRYAHEVLSMVPSGGMLVDVGCGAAEVTSYLAPAFSHVYGFDFSDSMLQAAAERVARMHLANITLCKGAAEAFPAQVVTADVIVSYGVVQYLTSSGLRQHFAECRKNLTASGVVCAAIVPNAVRKNDYYHRILAPTRGRGWRVFPARPWLLMRRVAASLRDDALWDGIGNWFTHAEIAQIADETGFEVEFRNSWYYDYRFHALLRIKS